MMKNTYLYLLFFLLLSCQHADQAFDKSFPQQAESIADQKEGDDEIVERKIIKEGEVAFESNDLEKTDAKIRQVVSDLKGYISSENMYESTDRTSYRLTVKVPSTSFEKLIELISEEAGTFDRKQISSQDVTEQFIDLETRLATKKELETRYLQLLGKAKSVEEILAIEKEIGTLREEVEAAEGKFRYLKSRVGFSTLDVNFYKKVHSSFVSEIGNAVIKGWHGMSRFVIALIYIWPFLILGAIGVFFFMRRRKNKKKA